MIERIGSEDRPSVEGPVNRFGAVLFTDIDDSTGLWERHADLMPAVLARHNQLVTAVVTGAGGTIVKNQGDGFLAVFDDPEAALSAAAEVETRLGTEDWLVGQDEFTVRVAIDLGEIERRDGDIAGSAVNRCSRILDVARRGQILVSDDVAERSHLEGLAFIDLGEFPLRGIEAPVGLHRVEPTDAGVRSVPGVPDSVSPTGARSSMRGFELRERIGAGVAGVVYRAHQRSVGREVAIKLIRPEFANDRRFVHRFDSEAQFIARLEHPHIVSLYDYWRDPDGAYLVMRWLRGGSLRQALDRGPWHEDRAIRLLQQVGSALTYAHRHGVIHRDVRPSNVLLDEEDNGYLSDFGIASRPITVGGGSVSTSPEYRSPEEDSGQPLTEATDQYCLGLLAHELLTGRRPSMPFILDLGDDAAPTVAAAVARATAVSPTERFASVEAFIDALAPSGTAVAPQADVSRDPFKGLRPFFESDAADFAGRDELIERLVAAVREHRLVAAVGASGSGKSSAVRAGLIPALRAGAVPGSDQWLITDLYPGAHPFDELAVALLGVATEPLPDLRGELSTDTTALLRAVKTITPEGSELVLVVDQFEELFTLSDEATQRAFVASLVELASDPHARARVVVTLRADFYDRPLAFSRLAPLLDQGLVTVGAPTADELALAINAPSENVGLVVERALVELIVDQVVDQPGGLPLLQYTLSELFGRRDHNRLTIDAFHEIGGVTGALASRADALFSGLDSEGRSAAEQVFLRLVSLDDTGEPTRRRVLASELGDSPSVRAVLETYGASRLLTFDRDPVTRDPTVEVAHEALLQGWPRLADWIDHRRDDLVTHRRFSLARREWDNRDRDPAYLLSGPRLAHFETWAGDTHLALTDSERAFFTLSRTEENRIQTRRQRIRRVVTAGFAIIALVASMFALVALVQRNRAEENELAAEQARIEAEASAREAERQQRIAEDQTEIAEEKAREALRAQRLARSRELAAAAVATLDEDPQLSILLAIEAAAAADPPGAAVETLHRAVQSQRAVFVHEFDGGAAEWAASPDGALLAITTDGASVRIVESRAGEPVARFSIPADTLLGDGRQLPAAAVRNRLLDDGYPVDEPTICSNVLPYGGTSALAFSPDGSLLVAALGDGRVHLFDVAAGREVPSPVPPLLTDFGPYCSSYVVVGFTPAGDGIVVAPQTLGASFTDWTEDVTIWPLSGEPAIEVAEGIPTGITARLDPSGERLAAADFWGFTTRIIDLTGSRPELVLESSREQLDAIFTPDGSHVITAGRERLAKMWDLSTGELTETFEGAETALSISDNDLLATAAFDGLIRIWDLDSRRLVTTLRGHQGVVTDVQITPDGSTVISGGYEDGTIRVWDLTGVTEAEVTGAGLDVYRVTGLELDENHAVVLTRPADVEPGTTYVFDLDSLTPVTEVSNQFGYGLRILPDGSGFAAEDVGDEFFGPIRVRDLSTGEAVGVPLEVNQCEKAPIEDGAELEFICPPYPEPGHWLFPIEIDVSPDGRYLAAGGLADAPDPNHAAVFDLRTGELLETWAYSSLYHHGVKFTPDGTHLAVGSNGDVRLYEVGTWSESVLIPYDGDAKHLDFTPDGSLIAIGGEATNLVVVADAATGEQLYSITDHQGDVTDLEVSEDGSLLMTAGTDGTIRLWDSRTGASVLTVPLETSGSIYAKFDPRDPNHIVFAREDGLIGVLTTDTEELLAIARERVLRDFTPAECKRFGVVCGQG